MGDEFPGMTTESDTLDLRGTGMRLLKERSDLIPVGGVWLSAA